MALKVYLVEDSAATRAHLSSILVTEASVDIVGVAETENQAIEWLDRNPDLWDIVLVDLFLEEGTGVVVLEHCHDRRPDQSVLVMTNHSRDDALLEHCRLLGADAVYHKATELDQLVAYCTGLSSRSRRRAASMPAV